MDSGVDPYQVVSEPSILRARIQIHKDETITKLGETASLIAAIRREVAEGFRSLREQREASIRFGSLSSPMVSPVLSSPHIQTTSLVSSTDPYSMSYTGAYSPSNPSVSQTTPMKPPPQQQQYMRPPPPPPPATSEPYHYQQQPPARPPLPQQQQQGPWYPPQNQNQYQYHSLQSPPPPPQQYWGPPHYADHLLPPPCSYPPYHYQSQSQSLIFPPQQAPTCSNLNQSRPEHDPHSLSLKPQNPMAMAANKAPSLSLSRRIEHPHSQFTQNLQTMDHPDLRRAQSSGQEGHGVHVCHKGGWPFPNPHPGAKNRCAHKKICGTVDGYKVVASQQLNVSDGEQNNSDNEDPKTPSPKVAEKSLFEKGSGGIKQGSMQSDDGVFSDTVAEFSDSGSAAAWSAEGGPVVERGDKKDLNAVLFQSEGGTTGTGTSEDLKKTNVTDSTIENGLTSINLEAEVTRIPATNLDRNIISETSSMSDSRMEEPKVLNGSNGLHPIQYEMATDASEAIERTCDTDSRIDSGLTSVDQGVEVSGITAINLDRNMILPNKVAGETVEGLALVTEKDLAKDQNSKFENPILKKLDSHLGGVLAEVSTKEDFTGKSGQSTVVRLPGLASKRVGLFGLGQTASSTTAFKGLGEAAAAAAKSAQASDIAIVLAFSEGLSAKACTASAIASGAVLGIYEDNRYKSESKKPALKSVDILGLGTGPELEKKLKYAQDVVSGIILGKELVNSPANVLTPGKLAEEASNMASLYSDVMSAKILNEEQCKDLKMGSYLAIAFNSFFRVLSRRENGDAAENLIQEMVTEFGCELNYQVFNTLRYACSKLGRVELGAKWFIMMLEHGVQPNVATFGMLMGLYQKGWNVEEAEFIFSRMRNFRIVCQSAYSARITIYTRVNLYDRAEEIIGLMKEDGVIPNLDTYIKLSRQFQKCKMIEDAVKLYEVKMDGPYKPSVHDVSMLLRSVSANKNPDLDLVFRVVKKFESEGFTLSKAAYDGIHRSLTNVGRFDEAEKTLIAMRNAGFEPDNITYSQLVFGLCKAKKFEEACKLLDDLNPKLLGHFAFGAKAVLNSMAAMLGGIVGQEVVKACSGKFHPLFQFFYFYSISVFGYKLQKKLEDAKVFMVGFGALGCELLKNVVLMGVSCGDQGKLTITDDDVIEKSNLSRQFPFTVEYDIDQLEGSTEENVMLTVIVGGNNGTNNSRTSCF